MRQRRNLTTAEVAHQLGMTRHGVESVEYGNIGASSAPFKSYIKYARFLQVSLRDVFVAVMTPSAQLKQKRQRKSSLSEEEIVDRVQQAIQRLKQLNKPVTQRTLLVKKIIPLLPQTPKSIQRNDSKVTRNSILWSYAGRRTLNEILRDIEEFMS